MRFLVLLLAVLAALPAMSHADCGSSAWLMIPAVVGDDGGLVNASMVLAPGKGDVYMNVFPRTGTNTQESLELAVAYARYRAKDGQGCDVLVDFTSDSGTGYIEGPSGGTALSVMAYSLFSGREMRHDTVITGAIDRSGKVAPVGGLYEKARSAAEAGAAYFITPTENLYELLLLKRLEGRYGITILQARNVNDVMDFMLENKSIDQAELSPKPRSVPDIPAYDAGVPEFRPVAEAMVALENRTVGTVPGSSNESAAIRDFFAGEAARQQGIIGRGYLFSAANEAFLNYIDISTIRALMAGEPDIPRKKGEIGICVSSLPRPGLTDLNFEWVVGADLRKAWAMDKYNTTETDGMPLEDEKFVAYNELMYGDAWCKVAKSLLDAAPAGGAQVSEASWEGLAERKLAEARELELQDPELLSRLNIAQESYGKGRYGAAIYDAAYVIAMHESSIMKAGTNETSLLVGEKRESLWGKVYQSHAAFMLAQNDSSGAYRTALFALSLDNVTAEMRAVAGTAGPPQDGNGSAGTQNQGQGTANPGLETGDWMTAAGTGQDLLQNALILITATVLIVVFLLVIAIILWSRRADDGNDKRTGKAYRAKPKKGRA